MSKADAKGRRPAIVAIGYDRVDSLKRLLGSIAAAHYPAGDPIPLIISLDRSGVEEVAAMAEAFDWPHGPKVVRLQPKRLGLREHILNCGDLSEEYGSVIVLEDDLLVSRYYYPYAEASAEFYMHDERVGGISLFHYRLNEFTNATFVPIEDGFDTYFLQVASSWGQMWTAEQWRLFRPWYEAHKHEPLTEDEGLPENVTKWRETSWKKYYIRYLALTGRYFAYPRASLSTNFADPGTHTKRRVGIYQTSLDFAARDWKFSTLDSALAIYDTYYEISPRSLQRLNPALSGIDFAVDLMGDKPLDAIKTPYLLSSKTCATPQSQFGLALIPPEASIAEAIAGETFSLAPTRAFGRLKHSTRLSITRHLNRYNAFNEYLFSLLKPLQIRIMQRLKP